MARNNRRSEEENFMSLLRRLERGMMPRPGENVEIFQHNRLIASGIVVAADAHTVTVAGAHGLIDLDTTELRRGLHDGSIIVKRRRED
jgi:hypothetical protein